MNKKIRGYYIALLKRSIYILPRFLLTILITIGILVLAGFLMLRSSGSDNILPKAQAAIVIEGNDIATSLTMKVVENIEVVNLVSDFQYVSEEEAEEGLTNGSIHAALYLPKDVYNNIDSGENTEIRVRIAEGSGLGGELFEELIRIATSLLQTGEATVYAIYSMSGQYLLTADVSTIMTDEAQKFLTLILRRGNVWNSRMVSPFGDMSQLDFYLITGILFLTVVIMGTQCAALYTQDLRSLEQVLRRYGVGSCHRTMARILPITLLLWVFQLGICEIISRYFYAGFDLGGVFGLVLLSFSEASMIHLLHILSGKSGMGFVNLLGGSLIFLIGGGLLPKVFLSKAMRSAALILPVEHWQRYLYQLLRMDTPGSSFGWILLFGAAFLVPALIIERAGKDYA